MRLSSIYGLRGDGAKQSSFYYCRRKFSVEFSYVLIIGGHLVRYPWSAISDWAWYRNFRYRIERAESDIISDIGINFYPISYIRHLNAYCQTQKLSFIALAYCFKGRGFESVSRIIFFLQYRISEWALMSILEHFRYRNGVFQSDIFLSDIGITDVDVGCRISPTLRSMLMPTYGSHVVYWRNLPPNCFSFSGNFTLQMIRHSFWSFSSMGKALSFGRCVLKFLIVK